MDKCAPGKDFKDGSCFSKKELSTITLALNQNTNSKIDINQQKKDLVEDLEKKFNKEYGCTDQKCWLSQKFIKRLGNDEISKYTFRPKGPSGKYSWLSTTNINEVIEQYEKKHDDFMYLGTVPYDFEDLDDLGIKDLNLRKTQNDGINKLGMVINLDYHYQSGSHWVALYTDLKKNQIYFFDSFAKKPRKKIKKFINRLTKYLYKKNYNDDLDINNVLKKLEGGGKSNQIDNLKKFDIKYNNIQHQFKNSECGVYSINFIIRLAKGEGFDSITKDIMKDDEMNLCREVYFN
tara:strand:- start:1399 stop:2271 length:873 start_codon:yes stop_codon:yes gene_type:complete